MLIFGVDIPLVEIIFVLSIVLFVLFVEAIVVITLLVKVLQKNKQETELLEKLSEVLLSIKKAEIEELDKIKKR